MKLVLERLMRIRELLAKQSITLDQVKSAQLISTMRDELDQLIEDIDHGMNHEQD